MDISQPSRSSGFDDLFDNLPIIDGHHHLWQIDRFPYRWLVPDAPAARFGDKRGIARDYLLDEHRTAFGDRQLTGSVHVEAHCGATDPVEETRWLQDVSDQSGWPLAIVGAVDLMSEGARDLVDRHRAFPALRGVRSPVAWDHAGRWRVASESGVLESPVFRNVAQYLADQELCLEMVVVPDQLDELAEFAHSVPQLQIVVDHFGTLEPDQPDNAARWRRGIARLASLPNVCVKLSGLWTVSKSWDATALTPFVHHLLDSIGADRVFYGSNAPVEIVNCPVSRQFEQLKTVLADRSKSEVRSIFHDTASRVFRFSDA
ncbi:amidohydrolase family protein [Shimia biformata]|uniref:amidohydrolase family protein n=1 Tax=Shimia biformata TaxID=1294299 RepID=UPI0019525E41|nr:amidohydrolase family protein [Shimia biformata]